MSILGITDLHSDQNQFNYFDHCEQHLGRAVPIVVICEQVSPVSQAG